MCEQTVKYKETVFKQFIQIFGWCFNLPRSGAGMALCFSADSTIVPPVPDNGQRMFLLSNSVSFILCLRTSFGVSRVVCGAHLRLLAPWTTRLLSRWIHLHWWRVNCNNAREAFPCIHDPSTPSTRLDRPRVNYPVACRGHHMTLYSRLQTNLFGKVCCHNMFCIFRDARAAVGLGEQLNVEDNGNLQKTKKTLPIMFISVHQQCWPQK